MALCRECGEWFVPEDVWDVYCSPECARAEWLREVKARRLSLSHQKKSLSHEEPEPKAAIEAAPTAEPKSAEAVCTTKPEQPVMKNARTVVCPICGREFLTNHGKAKYCSMGCKKEAARRREGTHTLAHTRRTCPICGKEFTPRNSTEKYCCKACSDKAKRRRTKADKKKWRAKKIAERAPYVKTCVFCGETFETKHAGHVTCDKCKATAVRDSKGRLVVLRTCPECGKEFRTFHHETVCCSPKCTWERKAKLASGNARTCEICGKVFVSTALNARCCSDECRNEKRRRLWHEEQKKKREARTFDKVCLVCKKHFKAADEAEECCSAECRNLLSAEKEKGKLHICAECGKYFGSNAPAVKYCSTECRDAAEKKRKGEPEEFVCATCGKAFRLARKGQSRKYCSPECADKGRRAYQVQRSMEIRNSLLPPPTRKCHDCGKPTDDYRCAECKAKWRAKYGVPTDGNLGDWESYRYGSTNV